MNETATRANWATTTLGPLVKLQTGKLDVNAGIEDGKYPFFTCSRETYKIDVAAFSGKAVIVAGNGDLNVKYFDGRFNAYQRTYVLQIANEGLLDAQFLFHFMDVYVSTLRANAQGSTIQYLKKAQFTDAPINLPPLSEQKRIVDVLASVDTYIAALQRQAANARAARNAVLHELLTAGGNDWTKTTLGEIAEYINGFPFKPEDLGEEGTPVIRIKQLLDPNEACDRTLIEAPNRCVLQSGDIVFSWSGTLAVRVWDRERAYLNQHLFRVVEKEGVLHNWLPFVIEHSIRDLSEMTHGTTMKHVTKQTLLPHAVQLPPLSEQKRIVETVAAMDATISTTEQTVRGSQKLRSSLLSGLLSGEHEIPASYDRLLGAA